MESVDTFLPYFGPLNLLPIFPTTSSFVVIFYFQFEFVCLHEYKKVLVLHFRIAKFNWIFASYFLFWVLIGLMKYGFLDFTCFIFNFDLWNWRVFWNMRIKIACNLRIESFHVIEFYKFFLVMESARTELSHVPTPSPSPFPVLNIFGAVSPNIKITQILENFID